MQTIDDYIKLLPKVIKARPLIRREIRLHIKYTELEYWFCYYGNSYDDRFYEVRNIDLYEALKELYNLLIRYREI